jgi:orotate phosphoribosyltransferase-like protein
MSRCVDYDCTLFSSQFFGTWGKDYLSKIPKEATHLLSASTSGAAVATLILATAALEGRNLSHCHIHPPSRRSHRGEEKVYSGVLPMRKENACVFVDDFIDSGQAIRTSVLILNDATAKHGRPKPTILCAVMGHNGQSIGAALFPFPVHFANGEESLNPEKEE